MIHEILQKINEDNLSGKTTYIGIAGAGRSGKDTLAESLKSIICDTSILCVWRALATPLKGFMYQFLLNNFNINVYNCTDEEKSLIRPLLVEAGRIKRIQTKGQYFTSLLEKEINSLEIQPETVIISDIRYAVYEGTDEIDWLKQKDGILLFVERFDKNGNLVPPANKDELENNIILRERADYVISWPTFDLPKNELITHVKQFLFQL